MYDLNMDFLDKSKWSIVLERYLYYTGNERAEGGLEKGISPTTRRNS